MKQFDMGRQKLKHAALISWQQTDLEHFKIGLDHKYAVHKIMVGFYNCVCRQ